MELLTFVMSEIVIGNGARSLVSQYALNFGMERVPQVCDPGVVTNPRQPSAGDIEAIYGQAL